ncbi:MAG: hypothetical protein WA733_13295, partial [Methylocystis sp.]
AFHAMRRGAAPGVDGMTWETYERDLDRRIEELYARVQAGTYRSLPSRRSYIPKEDGSTRPLAVAAPEDKIVPYSTFERVAKPLKSMNRYYRNAPAIACEALSSGRRWQRTVAGRREDRIRQRTTELKVVAALFERHYYVAQHGRFSSGIEWPIHSDGGPQQSCSLTAT